jgi:FKBP-type peptidyl-prolyl cis-trans isomerase FkpA
MFKKFFAVLLIVSCVSGCVKKSDCNYDPCSYKAPDSEIQAVKDYLATQGITNAVQHCSGLFYVIDNAGSGKKVTACSYVTVSYKGSFTNGNIFDQGTGFQTYLDGVIRGWTNGVPLIKKGGKIHLYIPPSLGYGSQPYGPIPGNSILVFEVELTNVQ